MPEQINRNSSCEVLKRKKWESLYTSMIPLKISSLPHLISCVVPSSLHHKRPTVSLPLNVSSVLKYSHNNNKSPECQVPATG